MTFCVQFDLVSLCRGRSGPQDKVLRFVDVEVRATRRGVALNTAAPLQVTFLVVCGGLAAAAATLVLEHVARAGRRLVTWVLRLKHLEAAMRRRDRRARRIRAAP